jgi:single-stranded-DNA-specific exonuclease
MKQWLLYPSHSDLSEKVAQKLGLSPLLAQLLLNRNIRSLDQARIFLNPSLTADSQFDAALLTGLLDLIKRCIADKTPILLYGDYDVDGMTSVSMMAHFLRCVGALVHIYVPHRQTEGYGLNAGVVDTLKHYEAKLLITLDCGISNAHEISLVKALGVSVAVLDHHTLPDLLPPADVILNPKSLHESSPLYTLCTAGIVYKCLEFFAQNGLDIDPKPYLDLAALGTIADVAHLQGENRRLVAEGLPYISKGLRPGIKALLETADFKRTSVSVRDVGFTIAPRLNAAGRLDSARLGVNLLLCDDYEEAEHLAAKLHTLNESRKALGTVIFQEACERLVGHTAPVIALASSQWHPGVIGIIASRLAEKFSKPTVLISVQDGLGRGSARSVGTVNIYEILKVFSSSFVTFGGHKEAAGFSINESEIDAFCTHIHEQSPQLLNEEDLCHTLDIDAELTLDHVGMELIDELSKLGPFGQGNPVPTFSSKSLKVVEARPVGNGQHLKFTFSNLSRTKIVDGIGFGLGEKLSEAYKPEVEVAFSLDINHWGGQTLPQLSVIDLK